MNTIMKTFFLILAFPLFLSFYTSAQNIDSLPEIKSSYLDKYSQQKVYLHFDKHNYFAGDDIWFKAYIINAVNHKPDTSESALYVELFNTKGHLIQKEIIHIEKGYGPGDFSLHDSFSEGNYLIRAYTPWMLNFQDDFIFTKNFFIQNPEEKNFISRSTRRENRRINRELEQKSEEFSINFYPEGGSLVYGLENRLAYHAQNSLGEGIDARVELINSAGISVSDFHSSDTFTGRGVTKFTPQDKERYTARVTFPNGRTRNFPVRNIKSSGYVLNVMPEDDYFDISVSGNPASFDSGLYLVIHTRGAIHEFLKINSNHNLKISNNDLPYGISVVSLFDQDASLIGERLFFNYPGEARNLGLKASRVNDGFNIQIDAPDHSYDSTSFSLSVVGSGTLNSPQLKENILTRILLTSDLTFKVENPLKYFTGYSLENSAVDLLMLSSDWQRMSWQNIIEDKTPDIVFRKLDGFPVFGNIEPTDESKEFDRFSFEVTLQIGDDLKVRSTKTNEIGNFVFDSIKEHGEFKAKIGILGLQRSNPRFLELFPDKFDGSEMDMNMHFRELPQRRGSNWVRTAFQPRKKSDRRQEIRDNLTYHYGSPDQIIYLKHDDERFRSMRDVLATRVSGVTVDGNSIVIRGPSSLLLSNQPMLLVDGQRYSSFNFLNLTPMDISHIEVYKGTSASIFGLHGANGVIVAHSRRSSIAQQLIFEYIFSGYHIPRDFEPIDTKRKNNFFDHPEYLYTVSWNPFIKLNESGQKSMQLEIPDGIKKMHIILEGVDAEGKIHHIHQMHEL